MRKLYWGILVLCLSLTLLGVLVFNLLAGRGGVPRIAEGGKREEYSASIPQLTICTSHEWNIHQGDGWANYSCKKICSDKDWTTCSYSKENELDVSGRSLRGVAFVVDGMGGEIKWNLPIKEKYTAGFFLHGGGGGASFYEESIKFLDPLSHALQREGLQVAIVEWEGGSSINVIPSGWFTRSAPDEKSSLREKARRPAAVIAWVRDSLIPASDRFGTEGCSGGSLATFSPVYWYGLDDKIDYQLLSGGPPGAWDVGAFCRAAPDPGEPFGICENNPELLCANNSDCGSARCATLKPPPGFIDVIGVEWMKNLVDYIVGESRAVCRNGIADPIFASSSYRLTDGSWQYYHPVDFIMSTGPKTGRGILDTDTSVTITYTGGRVYDAITTSDPLGKRWMQYPGAHCSWLKDPGFIHDQVVPAVRRGLRLDR